MSTAADLIAARLAQAGVRHAFGMPGGEVLALLDALGRVGIAFHLCRHENSGAFMAEGVHHMTSADPASGRMRVPGVLLATIGPGVLNAVNAAANAMQDQVPLIILSGCVDGAEAAAYTHQIVDQAGALRAVTKGSLRIEDGAVDIIIDRAVALALADPPGPVHVDLPVTLAARAQTPRPGLASPPLAPAAPAPSPMLDAARARIRAARRPVMIAGLGVLHHGAEDIVADLCRAHGMPLLTTYKAKGVLDEADPLALGGHGLSPAADAIVVPMLADADLIVLVGYDPVEMRPGWRGLWRPEQAIEVAHIAPTHGMHSAAMAFVGDVGAGLRALFDGASPAEAWADGTPARIRAALKSRFAGRAEWGPHAAFAALRRALPADAVVTADSGAHRILLSQMWEAPSPRTLLQSSGFCTMGCALGLAAGAKMAAPSRAVCAVMGDGGFEMVAGELATLRDLGLPVVVVVMADQSLGLIEMKQAAMGLPRAGVALGRTDLAAVAEGFGGAGRTVRDAPALAHEIAAALTRDRFTLIAVEIDKDGYKGAF
jgi:acetolactate synthase-1/2/3 large subunit